MVLEIDTIYFHGCIKTLWIKKKLNWIYGMYFINLEILIENSF